MFVSLMTYSGIQWKPDTMWPGRGTTIHVEVTSSIICYSTFFSPSLPPSLPFSLLPFNDPELLHYMYHSIQIIVRSCICCSNVEGEYVGLVYGKSCHNLVAVRELLSHEAGYITSKTASCLSLKWHMLRAWGQWFWTCLFLSTKSTSTGKVFILPLSSQIGIVR